MAKMTTMMFFVIFILTLSSLITYMPSQLYQTGYQGYKYYIPSEFEAWENLPRDYSIEKQISSGGYKVYDFSKHYNTTQVFQVTWVTIFGNKIVVYDVTSQIQQLGIIKFPFDPKIDRTLLVDSWNNENNVSYITIRTNKWIAELYFEDYNDARNNIGASFDDGTLNCTVVVPSIYPRSEHIGARELVVSILRFRLPQDFIGLNPMLGIIISCIFYVPLVFIFFNVIMIILHGD